MNVSFAGFRALLVVVFAFCLGVPQAFSAVSWQKSYDGGLTDVAGPILQTPDGGYLTLGRSKSFTPDNAYISPWLVKTDGIGEIEWQKAYDIQELAVKLVQVSDGYVFLTEKNTLVKVDLAGDLVWQKTYTEVGRGHTGTDLIVLANGDLLTIGQDFKKSTYQASDYRARATRIDRLGNIVWSKSFNFFGEAYAGCALETSTGQLAVGGFYYGKTYPPSVGYANSGNFVLLLQADGTLTWSKSLNGPLNDRLWDLIETSDHNILLTGTMADPYPVWEQPWLAKLDLQGSLLWQKRYPGIAEARYSNRIFEMPNGKLLMAGTQTGVSNYFMLTDASGDTPEFIGLMDGRGRLDGITLTRDNTFILSRYVGHYYSWQGDILLTKTRGLGESCRASEPMVPQDALLSEFIIVDLPPVVTDNISVVSDIPLAVIPTAVIPNDQCIDPLPIITADAGYDFGAIGIANQGQTTLTINNLGDGDLDVISMQLNQGGTGFTLNNNCQIVVPGATCSIDVSFAPLVPGPQNGTIRIETNDPVNPVIEVTLTGRGVDLTPPLLTLLGTNPVTIEATSTYLDAGATAIDNIDGDITGAIVTTSSVDATQPGNYQVSYSVSDAAGNTASASRSVLVVDTTPPSVSLLGAANITLTAGTPYVEPGATAVDAVDGDLSTAVVISGIVDTLTPGRYLLNYTVSDAAGNVSVPVTRTIVVTAPVSNDDDDSSDDDSDDDDSSDDDSDDDDSRDDGHSGKKSKRKHNKHH